MDISTILGYAGCAFAIGIPAIGSSFGVLVPGSVSHGVMAKVEEGHGKFIGISAAPSSQTIYGLILMFVLMPKVEQAGLAVMFIGLFCGLAIMTSAILQGKVAATAILASSKKQEIFGKCFAAAGIIESFAIFALVAGIVMVGNIETPPPQGHQVQQQQMIPQGQQPQQQMTPQTQQQGPQQRP